MSNFIEELNKYVGYFEDFEESEYLEYNTKSDVCSQGLKELINSLGENARRMLEIGIVQDELVKIGFELSPISFYGSKCHGRLVYQFPGHAYPIIIAVSKDLEKIILRMDRDRSGRYHHLQEYYFDSSTWQQDLLAEVRELIGDKS